jgi:hypothetical protein
MKRRKPVENAHLANEMGRKLEFNYERALERATGVFWAKGYSAASSADVPRSCRKPFT